MQKLLPEKFCKERCSWKFPKTHKKTPVSEPFFLKKFQASGCISCEFSEISKQIFFSEHLWVTASLSRKNKSITVNIFVCMTSSLTETGKSNAKFV